MRNIIGQHFHSQTAAVVRRRAASLTCAGVPAQGASPVHRSYLAPHQARSASLAGPSQWDRGLLALGTLRRGCGSSVDPSHESGGVGDRFSCPLS